MREFFEGSSVSRRLFLSRALQLGAGAAAAAAVGRPQAAYGTPRPPSLPGGPLRSITKPPPEPPGVRLFVSRPDLRPPGVNVASVAGLGASSAQPRFIFLTPHGAPGGKYPAGAKQGLMIVDLEGHLVWFRALPIEQGNPFNLRVQQYRGKSVLSWFRGSGLTYGTSGNYVIADDSYRPIAEVSAYHQISDLHEFLLTPHGTALLTAYQPLGKLVVGHAQEVDVATGDLVFDWTCYPEVSPSESFTGPTGDYFHINSVGLWPGPERNLLVSGRNCSAVYLIDRRSKKILWRLGGKKSDFALGPGAEFSYQHDARALADGSGLSLFDDASPPSAETESSGKVLTLDTTSRVASLRHRYVHTTSLIDTGSQGNVQLLPTGGHFVGWGADPYFSEFAASGAALTGNLILDGRLPVGVDSYRALMFDWVADPSPAQIALVVRREAGSGHFTAHASWNGATEIAAWRMSAGPSPSALSALTPVRRQGFETTMPVTRTAAKYFEATAIDRHGATLGVSKIVEAS